MQTLSIARATQHADGKPAPHFDRHQMPNSSTDSPRPLERKLLTRIALKSINAGIRLPGADAISRYRELSELRELLTRLEIDCVLDVGANIGQFGSDLRGIGYTGWICSFEPSPEVYSILTGHLDARWCAYPVALAAHDEQKEFFFDQHSVNNSFLKLKGADAKTSTTVNARRLDGMIDEIIAATGAKRLFLKCDTQGFDLEVIKGAGDRLGEFLGLMSEVSVRPIYDGMPHYLQSLQEYEQRGFQLHSLHVVSATEHGEVVEYNAMLTNSRIGSSRATA
jgi:FkbM family methyltransferase